MANMENPLEVLSRAASMVETNDAAREAALKRSLEEDDNDLPPKYKYRHLSTSSQPPSSDSYSSDSSDQNHNRRCAGTQTSFSSFPHEIYPTGQGRPGGDYKILDLDDLSSRGTGGAGAGGGGGDQAGHIPGRHLHIPAMVSARASPYPTRHLHRSSPPSGATGGRGSPRSPPSSTPSGGDSPTSPGPLNLTTSITPQHHDSNITLASTSPQQHRPSVITIAPSPAYMSPPRRSSPTHSHSPPPPHPAAAAAARTNSESNVCLFIVPDEPCGSSIDEHFRRSLGGNYPAAVYSPKSPPQAPAAVTSPPPAVMSPRSRTSPTRSRTPPSPLAAPPVYQHPADMPPAPVAADQLASKPNVSVVGSVDDHFAKALGDKWKEINAPKPQSPPHQPEQQQQSPQQPMQLDILAGSVDDHFAKALGDTWLKIKAEKERPTPNGGWSTRNGERKEGRCSPLSPTPPNK